VNMYCEINAKRVWDKAQEKYVMRPATHYNRNAVRVKQGKTRKRKGDYWPKFARAREHVGDDRISDRAKAQLVLMALEANAGDGLL